MPTYVYACKACEHQFEKFQSFAANALRTCPNCGEKALSKVIFPAGVVFKGSGFYINDSKASQSTSSTKDSTADSSSETSSASSKDADANVSESKKSTSKKSDSKKSAASSSKTKDSKTSESKRLSG